jgi:hypothetical protein
VDWWLGVCEKLPDFSVAKLEQATQDSNLWPWAAEAGAVIA